MGSFNSTIHYPPRANNFFILLAGQIYIQRCRTTLKNYYLNSRMNNQPAATRRAVFNNHPSARPPGYTLD